MAERTVPSFIKNITPLALAVIDFTFAGTNSAGTVIAAKESPVEVNATPEVPQEYSPLVVSKKY